MNTTDARILAALKGEPAPKTITPEPHPASSILTSLPSLVAECLETAARTHVTEMQLKDGADPADARATTDIEIRIAYEAAVKAGHNDLDALQHVTRHLDKRNAYYKGRTTLASTRVFAEAQANAYTPRILRQIKEA